MLTNVLSTLQQAFLYDILIGDKSQRTPLNSPLRLQDRLNMPEPVQSQARVFIYVLVHAPPGDCIGILSNERKGEFFP